jgi:hypothetical protein
MDQELIERRTLVWVQLALAFFGAIFIVERLFYFHRARINVSSLLVGLGVHIKRRAFAEALHGAARAWVQLGRWRMQAVEILFGSARVWAMWCVKGRVSLMPTW